MLAAAQGSITACGRLGIVFEADEAVEFVLAIEASVPLAHARAKRKRCMLSGECSVSGLPILTHRA